MCVAQDEEKEEKDRLDPCTVDGPAARIETIIGIMRPVELWKEECKCVRTPSGGICATGMSLCRMQQLCADPGLNYSMKSEFKLLLRRTA